ncbi:MAG TPA: TonB-dependent receptor, partial [Acidobacteriaceae bacterium]|nr:TonB-dependent receptor [Acidobacteriaceae bacterium]
AERSRTFDVGVDQNILGEKLVLKAGYYHNVFNRQLESVTGANLATYFGLNSPEFNNPDTSPFYYTGLYLNSLAYRAQGAEAELDWQATRAIYVRAGYTYLLAKVLQSFASDAVAAKQGTPTENPNLPGIAIGAESPLVGGRPFRRAPDSGFFAVTYARPKLAMVLKGAFAGRSDDSTYLDGYTPSFDNSLLLPNRDLDFGYLKLDLGGTYQLGKDISVFTQLENLLNDQHIGPIGYPGLPLTVRAGLKVRLGGD